MMLCVEKDNLASFCDSDHIFFFHFCELAHRNRKNLSEQADFLKGGDGGRITNCKIYA